MLSGWMGVSPELRVEVTFLMTFSSVNSVKVGDGHNMEAINPIVFIGRQLSKATKS